MGSRREWLPRRNNEVLAMARKWIIVLTDPQAVWGVPQADVTKLQACVTAVDAAEANALACGGGKVANAVLKAAYAELRSHMRFMHSVYFGSPPLGDVERVMLDLPIRDRTPTRWPAPVERMSIEPDTANVTELTLRFYDPDKIRRARPPHAVMIKLKYAKLGARPSHRDQLTNTEVFSATHFTIHFDEADRGDLVYFTACWINTHGEEGPWSDIESSVIP